MYKEVDLLHRSIVSCAVHLQLARRQRVYRQGVDIGCHEITQCLVDEAVTLDTIQALEPRGNDRDAEMAASVGGPGMPGMLMTLVFDLNVLGGQRLLKAIPNLVDPSHESVLIAVPSPFGFSAFILAAPVAVQQAMRTMSAMAQMIEVHPRDPQSRRLATRLDGCWCVSNLDRLRRNCGLGLDVRFIRSGLHKPFHRPASAELVLKALSVLVVLQ
jgi:hypothetical protein